MSVGKWVFYVEIIAVVSADRLLVSLFRVLKTLDSKIVLLDEVRRRVIFKMPLRAASKLPALLEWFSYGSLEFKFGAPLCKRLAASKICKMLRKHGFLAESHRNKVIIFKQFDDYSFFGEIKGGRLFGKLCRRAGSPIFSPYDVPPSLCTFSLDLLRDPRKVEAAGSRLITIYKGIVDLFKTLDAR